MQKRLWLEKMYKWVQEKRKEPWSKKTGMLVGNNSRSSLVLLTPTSLTSTTNTICKGEESPFLSSNERLGD